MGVAFDGIIDILKSHDFACEIFKDVITVAFIMA